jgi:myo-inositol-1(or 4)-monophosphatase
MTAASMPPDSELAFVVELARAAGARMLRAAARGAARTARSKGGPIDLVTDVDREIDAMVGRALAERFPHDRVVGEEGTADVQVQRADADTWYIDPLDGTTNFVHGYPFWAVSIGRWRGGQPLLGVVYAPALDELFYAARGEGAFLRSARVGARAVPLRVSSCARLADALVATGYPYARGPLARVNMACTAHALQRTQGVRRAGAASLDLCHLAAGRLDGFWELGLHSWDVAAGVAIAAEAGATASDLTGGSDFLHGERICIAAPGLHGELLALLAEAHRDPEHSPLGRPIPGAFPLVR